MLPQGFPTPLKAQTAYWTFILLTTTSIYGHGQTGHDMDVCKIDGHKLDMADAQCMSISIHKMHVFEKDLVGIIGNAEIEPTCDVEKCTNIIRKC